MNKAYEVGWVVRVLCGGELIKDNRPSEIFLEKHKFCPKTAHSVVQAWCKKEKEKCKCLKIKHLHFVVPGAAVEIINLTKIILN